jgi:predicted Zn-dependent protease
MSQNASKRGLVIGIVIALCLIAAGCYIIRTGKYSSSPTTSTTASTTTATAPGSDTGVQVTGGTATVRDVNSANVPAPDHSSPLVFTSSVTTDVQQALNAQYAQIKTILAKDPYNFSAWITLGTVNKIAGNFNTTAADWQYVTKIYPKDHVAFDNLGDLYINFIKDYPKAEMNLKEAVTLFPQDLSGYENLFSLYADYGYKAGTGAAEAIMNEAIEKNPASADLHVLFAHYYAKKGDAANAKIQFNAAIALYQKTGNTDAAAELQTEEAAL